GAGSGDGDRSGRGDLEGVLEELHELGELQKSHLLEGLEQLVVAELRHGGVLSVGPGAVRRPGSMWGYQFFLSSSAANRRASCEAGALNRPAALVWLPLRAPAIFASRTSRDSRSAILSSSVADSGEPSMTPPLMTSALLSLAKFL